MRFKQPLPDAIQNAPTLQLGLLVYMRAFWQLNTCRTQAESPIPWDKIEYYGERKGFTGSHLEDLHYIIGMMDEAYLDHVAEKRRQANNQKQGQK